MEQQYAETVRKWEASLPHEVTYYTEHIERLECFEAE